MKAFGKLMIVVSVGTLALGGRVLAQDNANDPWALSAELSSQFSDNRDGLDTNKESNVDVSFAPRADLRWRDGERTWLDVFLVPSVVWHSNPREEETGVPQNDAEIFCSAGINGQHYLTPRVAIKAGDTLTYNDDPAITLTGTTDRQSASHWLNAAHAGVDAAVVEKIGVSALGTVITKRYTEEDVADQQDEDTYQGEGDLKYMMGSGYSVFGLVGYSQFSANSEGPGALDRGSDVTSFGVGLERVLSPDITGKIVGGYQIANYDEATLDSTDTMNGSLLLSFREASPTRFKVAAAYGYYPPNVRPYSVQTLTAVSGSVEHDLLPNRLTIALQGQYSEGEYDEVGSLPGGTDKLSTVGLWGRYQLNRTWSFRAGYTHETWDSDVRESFDRNLVDAGVTARL